MPIFIIDGISVKMSVAEFVEYQQLSKAQAYATSANVSPLPVFRPAVVPEPQPAPPPKRSNKSDVRRQEMQAAGYQNAAAVNACFVFMVAPEGADFKEKIPNELGFNLDTIEGRHAWFMSQDHDGVRRFNIWSGTAMRLREARGRQTSGKYWAGSVIAALWAMDICYGSKRADEVQVAVLKDSKLFHAIMDRNAEMFEAHNNDLIGLEKNRKHLSTEQQLDLFGDVFLLLAEHTEAAR